MGGACYWFSIALACAVAIVLGWSAYETRELGLAAHRFDSSPPSYWENQCACPSNDNAAVSERCCGDVGALERDFGGVLQLGGTVPPHDDAVWHARTKTLYVTAQDGYLWQISGLDAGNSTPTAKRGVKLPSPGSGARWNPANDDELFVCTGKIGVGRTEHDDSGGLRVVNVASGEVHDVLLSLPQYPEHEEGAAEPITSQRNAIEWDGETGWVKVEQGKAVGERTRHFGICNDMDVTRNGRYVFISEPTWRQSAGMGSGIRQEALYLRRRGSIWVYDTVKRAVALVSSGHTFADGVLLSSDENSLLFTETVKFRILRMSLSGAVRAEDSAHDGGEGDGIEVLHDNMPGMPDGFDRDEHGRVWVGLVKKRTADLDFIHEHLTLLKPLLNIVPEQMLPIPKESGAACFDESGERALWYFMHDGSLGTDFACAVPVPQALCGSQPRLWLPQFNEHKNTVGLLSINVPAP